MVFKASRKPPKDAVNSKWQYRDEDIPIPPICLDLSLRRVPKDFKLDIPATPQKKRASVSSTGTGAGTSDMEVAQPDPDPATEQNAF
jgi:TATA-binding protein-associated factor Taf7